MTDVDARKNCPYENESEVRSLYLAGRLSEAEAQAFERHYFYCPACTEAIEVGTRLRAGFGKRPVAAARVAPPRPLSTWVALAAAAAVALLAVGLWQAAHLARPTPGGSVLRGGAEARLDVRVEADQNGALAVRWAAIPGAARYAVRVLTSDGVEVWKTETDETRSTVRPSELSAASEKSLLVEVDALDARSRVVATSAPAKLR